MTHAFDKDYWERHWHQAPASTTGVPPNPYLARESAGLTPGTALDAGCGSGAEAIWLAGRGWQVTAADISAEVLSRAAERVAADPSLSVDAGRVRWVEADLTVWTPDAPFDLVMTHYAHPAMPQLDFYDRIAGWVAPGGTLLIVGHLHTGHGHGHGHGPGHGHGEGHGRGEGDHPPQEASVTSAAITARLDSAQWEIVTATEHQRFVPGREIPLDDVVVRATRRRPRLLPG